MNFMHFLMKLSKEEKEDNNIQIYLLLKYGLKYQVLDTQFKHLTD